jgi:predicted unusual protein kinase regulating ubiquinone biosynthesis (AarF/ABC1/UbiB family)
MFRSRYRKITWFFARVLTSFAFWDLLLPRLGFRGLSRRTRARRFTKTAGRFRSLAIEMGGVMIKVGQFLSSRVDVLPVEITSVLGGLQDEVPPEKFEAIREVAEAEFGEVLEKKYLSFDEQPLAAASLGQVHLARLPDITKEGQQEAIARQVVVKVQRPDIEQIIRTDLAALRTVGQWLKRYRPLQRRVNIPSLLDEFTRILFEEIDYLNEGKNAEIFARNFADEPQVRVPDVFWSHTTRRVLTLEDVRAIKIKDYNDIEKAGVELPEVARLLINTYLKQIFEDGFFHADPHPGNLFVCPGCLEAFEDAPSALKWQLTFIDFGMVGRVKPEMLMGMRELVIGVGTRNPGRMVRSYQMLNILLPGADLELLERVEVEIFDRFWGQNMSELTQVSYAEVRELAVQFRDLLYKMPFQVPEDLILLGRAVGILSGMATGLDPKFNVWDAISPFAQKLIAEDAGEDQEPILKILKDEISRLMRLPFRVEAVLEKVEKGEIIVRTPHLADQITRLEASIEKVAAGIVFTALFLGGVQLLQAGLSPYWEIVLGLSGLVLVWFFISYNRIER